MRSAPTRTMPNGMKPRKKGSVLSTFLSIGDMDDMHLKVDKYVLDNGLLKAVSIHFLQNRKTVKP